MEPFDAANTANDLINEAWDAWVDAPVEDERDQCLAKLAGMKVETWLELTVKGWLAQDFVDRIVAEYNDMQGFEGGMTAKEL